LGKDDSGTGGGIFQENWLYIHDPAVKVGRIQNYRSWSPEMVPAVSPGQPERTFLGVEYFCFKGDGLWESPDHELIALAKKELLATGILKKPEHFLEAFVNRQEKAYPVYDETYKDHVRSIRDEIAARYPGLHVSGRNGMHKYNNQDHAMMTGILTAKNIIAGQNLWDIWRVNQDAEYLESPGGKGGLIDPPVET
jgi:protoporphyrinogen oxidase